MLEKEIRNKEKDIRKISKSTNKEEKSKVSFFTQQQIIYSIILIIIHFY